MRRLTIFSALTFGAASLFAQEEIPQYNPNSLNPIPRYEQLYKVKVWRHVRLDEKQNKGFFASKNELTKLILEAINSGELADLYMNDSLTTKKSKDAVLKDLILQEGEPADPWQPTNEYYEKDPVDFNGVPYRAMMDIKGADIGKAPDQSPALWRQDNSVGKPQYAQPLHLSQIRIVEDMIFDKRRSRLYYDIQSITIIFPLDKGNPKGGDLDVVTLKYKDLVQVFRNHPADAVWFNRHNTAENKNYEEAFLLRLFHGIISKVENPDNWTIEEVYSARPYNEQVWAREWEEMRLMEKEHNLWEY